MEYNTSREGLRMPEYGRNIQKMVEHLKTIEDRAKRQKYAESIIEIMSVLHPQFKNSKEYHNNLWDHLFVIADYDLDVDCPYPIMTKEIREAKPDPLPYPNKLKKNKHLGKNLNRVIDLALNEEDEERQRGFTNAIAYYMKMAYNNWHNEAMHDDMIREELMELTDGALTLEDNIKVHHSTRRPRAKQTSRRTHTNQRNPRTGGSGGPRNQQSRGNHRNNNNNNSNNNNNNRRRP